MRNCVILPYYKGSDDQDDDNTLYDTLLYKQHYDYLLLHEKLHRVVDDMEYEVYFHHSNSNLDLYDSRNSLYGFVAGPQEIFSSDAKIAFGLLTETETIYMVLHDSSVAYFKKGVIPELVEIEQDNEQEQDEVLINLG